MLKVFTGIACAALVALSASSAAAIDFSGRPLTVQDEIVKKECGACHMVFPPTRLTKGGWTKIMATLSDHFGEDASLKTETVKHIEEYLVANALDAKGGIRTELRLKAWAKKGLIDPIRITDTPEWTRHHPQKESYRNMAKDVGYTGGANCIICHKGAEHGLFEDKFDK